MFKRKCELSVGQWFAHENMVEVIGVRTDDSTYVLPLIDGNAYRLSDTKARNPVVWCQKYGLLFEAGNEVWKSNNFGVVTLDDEPDLFVYAVQLSVFVPTLESLQDDVTELRSEVAKLRRMLDTQSRLLYAIPRG